MLEHILKRIYCKWMDYKSYCSSFGRIKSLCFMLAPYYPSFFRLKHRTILEYLEPGFRQVLNKIRNSKEIGSPHMIDESRLIWVLWLQGRKTMPKIVEACVMSIEKHCGNRKVIVISLDEVKQLVDIPAFIYERYDKGIIQPAHFSDIIRMALLSRYGGIWMDATIYLSSRLPDYGNLTFYSIKRHKGNLENVGAEDGTKWTTYFVACGKDNIFVTVIYEYMIDYLKTHEKFPDYLFMDYCFALLYNNSRDFREAVGCMPFDNEGVSDMLHNLNQPYSKKLWDKLQKNIVNKLTYKLSLKDGHTIAEYLIKNIH